MAQQYNPRRKQAPPAKKKRPSGASPTTRGKSRQPVPGWLWLVAGIAVGVFVSLLMKLSSAPLSSTPVAMPGGKAVEKEKVAQTVKAEREKAAREKAAEKEKAEKKAPDDAKPATRFDFYTLLPEREVIVPDREAMQQKNAPGQPAQPATPAEALFLQAGSFRSPQEADRRRAQILLLGLDARVESVVANGDTWYRVHAGPFTSREKLTKARDQLSAEGIETLLLKQKPTG